MVGNSAGTPCGLCSPRIAVECCERMIRPETRQFIQQHRSGPSRSELCPDPTSVCLERTPTTTDKQIGDSASIGDIHNLTAR